MNMRLCIVFLLFGCLRATFISAQITVTQSDMPVAGDTLRMSLTNVVPDGFAKSAMDTTWNYAMLEALSQRVDTFVSATSTPAGYQLFFVLLGGANLAAPRSTSLVPGLPLSDGFTYFKNSAASYSDLGSAYTVQGLPLPAKYDIPDKLYQFPMTPGLNWNSVSSFEITVPGLAFYSTRRTRSNLVDGWGALTTPYGTFQTLRVKSIVNQHDSIYIDSLATGFPFDRNIIEYKWIANNEGVPVLQITEEGALVTATYRDIYRMAAQPLVVSLGPDTAVLKGTTINLEATVTGGTPPYQLFWNTFDTTNSITITAQEDQTYTVLVVDALQTIATDQVLVSIKYPPGFAEASLFNLKVFPTPSQGIVRLSHGSLNSSAVLYVYAPSGQILMTLPVTPVQGEFTLDLSALPNGIYWLKIISASVAHTAKVQIIH